MSINIINRATNNKGGTGLPFYENIEYIFSNRNNAFDNINGLWRTPANLIPTFQIETEPEEIGSIEYRETSGQNEFTGTIYTTDLLNGIKVKSITKNGQSKLRISSDYSYSLPTPPANSRWIIVLTVVNTDSGFEKSYFSEEFLTTDCC
jgi:hypothetical protein